jgi:hypothetical protein
MHEAAPTVEVYITPSSEPPGGMGEAGTSTLAALARGAQSACYS